MSFSRGPEAHHKPGFSFSSLDWSVATIEGLNKAADWIEYSLLNMACQEAALIH